jgi:hypothetical protein
MVEATIEEDIEAIENALDMGFVDDIEATESGVGGTRYIVESEGEMWQDDYDLGALAEAGFIVQNFRAREDGHNRIVVGRFSVETKEVEVSRTEEREVVTFE